MPAPRAVAGQRRAEPPYPEPEPAMSDLTTTMPLLAVPADDGYYEDEYDEYDGYDGPDYDNAPPGEHGHYHDDADFGRHRGGTRPPRALKIGAILAGVAVVGVAAYSVLGGSNSPSTGPAAAGASTAGAAGAPSDSASDAGAPAPTGTPTGSLDSASQTTPSASHSTKSSSKASTTSRSSSSAPTTSRPSSTPSTNGTTAAPPPPSSPSPTFTSLGPGSSGAAVTQLQQNLKSWGGYYGWPPLHVNGTYDTATKNAVEAFQDANQGTSPPDPYGVYGPATDKAMRQATG
jgi:hypothetical protein